MARRACRARCPMPLQPLPPLRLHRRSLTIPFCPASHNHWRAQTPEQRRAAGLKGGAKGGAAAVALGVGIHGMARRARLPPTLLLMLLPPLPATIAAAAYNQRRLQLSLSCVRRRWSSGRSTAAGWALPTPQRASASPRWCVAPASPAAADVEDITTAFAPASASQQKLLQCLFRLLIFGPQTPEQRRAAGLKGGAASAAMGVGVHGMARRAAARQRCPLHSRCCPPLDLPPLHRRSLAYPRSAACRPQSHRVAAASRHLAPASSLRAVERREKLGDPH